MPERVPVYEPEVEALIAEIAADPRSYLLREPQRGLVGGPLDLEEGVSVRTAGLTVAEREVVRVWRADAAELLKHLHIREFESDPSGGKIVARASVVGEALDRTPTEDLIVLAQVLRESGRCGHVSEAIERAIRGSLIHPPGLGLARGQLIRLSHRLMPTDASRTYLAIEADREGSPRRALAMYDSILERSVTDEGRAYALVNANRTYSALGDMKNRIETAGAAIQAAPAWSEASIKVLETCLDAGDLGSASDALNRLVHDQALGLETLTDYLEWLRRQRTSEAWSPTPRFRTTWLELAEVAPEMVRDRLNSLGCVL